MDINEAVKRLNAFPDGAYPSDAHKEADEILLTVLREYGYERVADAWDLANQRVGFWYE